jgi:hypothetical protein
MKVFTRTFKAGKTPEGWNIWVTIDWDEKRLAITGVEGPLSNGDCKGSCGQIDISEVNPRLAEIWKEWHLNDMQAGCDHQQAEGWDKLPIDPTKPLNAYGKHFKGQTRDSWNILTWVSPKEHPKGLLTKPCEVCGYKYGTQWLIKEVPEEILIELAAFSDEKAGYPWRHS